jgi:hypothetical protein
VLNGPRVGIFFLAACVRSAVCRDVKKEHKKEDWKNKTGKKLVGGDGLEPPTSCV